jgi:hypothetical protein
MAMLLILILLGMVSLSLSLAGVYVLPGQHRTSFSVLDVITVSAILLFLPLRMASAEASIIHGRR